MLIYRDSKDSYINKKIIIHTSYGGSYNKKVGLVIGRYNDGMFCGWYSVYFQEPLVHEDGVMIHGDIFLPNELEIIGDNDEAIKVPAWY